MSSHVPHDPIPPDTQSSSPWPPDGQGPAISDQAPAAQFHPSWRPLPPEGVQVPNLFAWLLVGSLGVMLVLQPVSVYVVVAMLRASASKDPEALGSTAVMVLVLLIAAVGIRVAIVLFGFFDSRRLKRAGVVRPFHWAWIFLGPEVYMIGRTVILWNATRKRVLAPMIAFAVGYVLVVVLGIIAGFAVGVEEARYVGPGTVSGPIAPAPGPMTSTTSGKVTSPVDGVNLVFRAAPKAGTAQSTVAGVTITEHTWTLDGSAYPLESVNAAHFSCTPTVAKQADLMHTAVKSMMYRLTGYHGTGTLAGTETTTIGSYPAQRTTVDFIDQRTGANLSARILTINRGSSQIIAIAIGPEDSSDQAHFIDTVQVTGGGAGSAASCAQTGN